MACSSSQSKREKSNKEKKAEIYYNQGTNELISKEYTLALKYLLEAYSLAPKSSKILNNLGMAYYFKKKPKIAMKYVKSALKQDPKNTDARVNLATIYSNLKQYRESKRQYDILLNDLTYERQFKTYYNLGLLAIKQNKQTEAISYFKQSLNENINYCPASFQLGNIAFKKREYPKALKLYKQASMGTCYNSPGPIYHQALSLIELKEYGPAKEKLTDVIDRFSLTPYQIKATRKLKALNTKIERRNQKFESPSHLESDRNILTPDF